MEKLYLYGFKCKKKCIYTVSNGEWLSLNNFGKKIMLDLEQKKWNVKIEINK